ncbi:MAG: alcohol dehydrogenase catalytic domain-containing protein [Solirubrobacterales bacterium]
MRAAVYHGRRDVRVEAVPDPGAPGPEEVTIRIDRTCICATDASEWAKGPMLMPTETADAVTGHLGPVIIGHEMFGRIEAIGEDVSGLAVGDRVVPGAGMWCGECAWCRRGQSNLCESYYTHGLETDGGMAELVNVPALMCIPVPVDCTDAAAPFAQPLAVALHSVRVAGVQSGDSVAVIGVGAIGFFALAAVLAWGARPVVALDIDPERLAQAESFGATATLDAGADGLDVTLLELSGGAGFDFVVEASGAEPSPQLAQRVVRRGGTILQVALHDQPRPLDLSDLALREVQVVSTLAHICDVDIPEALELLRDERLADAVRAREIGLERIVEEGLEPLSRGEVSGKVVVNVGDEPG